MTNDVVEDKIADIEYDIHPIIQQRWSPRAFSDEPVDSELLRQLFDAARWAPSSYNEQPWRFIIATNDHPEEFETMSQVLNENNRQWATNAPVLGLALKKERFERNDKPNRHAAHDVGQAMAYLTFEATRHDLYVHQMAGILPNKARELYQMPEGFSPLTMFAIGYLGEPEQLRESLQKGERKPRSRRAIDDIVSRGSWDEAKNL